MLRLAFDFIIAWREIRARPNAYKASVLLTLHGRDEIFPRPW